MAGCLDNFRLPECECINFQEKRNAIASVSAGILFSLGWWFVIDAAAVYTDAADMPHHYHAIGVVGTVGLLMVNAISTAQIRGDAWNDTGCMGQMASRIWLIFGFLLSFGALIAGCWVLFGEYIVNNCCPSWPGIALFLQNAFIFFSNVVYKFGRTEDLWD